MGDDLLRRLDQAGILAPSQPRLRVPGNLVDVVRVVSQRTGVPFEIIAGVVQAQYTSGTSGDWPATVTPDVVAEIGSTLRDARGGPFGSYRLAAQRIYGGSRATWLDRFDSIVYARDKEGQPDLSKPEWIEREPSLFREDDPRAIPLDTLFGMLRRGTIDEPEFRRRAALLDISDDDIDLYLRYESQRPGEKVATVDIGEAYSAFHSIVGRYPSEDEAQQYVGMTPDAARAALLVLPEAVQWRKEGPRIQRERGWIDGIWQTFYGKVPTNAEVMEVLGRGHTPESLRRYLSDQPVGNSTLGEMRAVREMADKYAGELVGREADDGEINWLVTNKVTTPDAISAYYEQLKQRIDSGDEFFAWAADPQTWRTMRDQLQSIWQRSGMTGLIDPALVNRAVQEKWDAQRTQEYVDDLPAPGLQGVSVGEAKRVRGIAEAVKEFWLPGQPLTSQEIALFVDKNAEDMRRYYRSLPVEMRRNFKPDKPPRQGGQTEGTEIDPGVRRGGVKRRDPTEVAHGSDTESLVG